MMRWIILLLAVLFSATLAQAHPHAWIDYTTKVVFKGGKIIGLHETWYFTEDYASFLLADYDENKNRKLDKGELLKIAQQSLQNLKDYHYFTDIKQDNNKIPYKTVSNIGSHMAGRRLVMEFTLELVTPLDPVYSQIAYKIYDPSFFTEMRHLKTENPVILENAPENCTYKLINPKVSANLIAQAMAIDKNGKAPMGLGEYMAQEVTITCP
jgi:ABC-type uncharacterized transport system substrate-binding protein